MSFPGKIFSLKIVFNSSKNKKITYHDSLQNISGQICYSLGKMSLFASSKKKGSFTLETAVVLPLFLFFMLTIFVFFDALKEQGHLQEEFVNAAKSMALSGAPSSEEDMIKMQTIHQVQPKISFFTQKRVYGYVLVSARAWTGADEELYIGSDDENMEMVYKTSSGSVYHTNPNCSYLNPSIEAVSSVQVSKRRNDSGEIYHACESCGKHEAETVYITDYGNRYHSDITCSSLKRNILVIPKAEAKGYPHCSKCAAWEAFR